MSYLMQGACPNEYIPLNQFVDAIHQLRSEVDVKISDTVSA